MIYNYYLDEIISFIIVGVAIFLPVIIGLGIAIMAACLPSIVPPFVVIVIQVVGALIAVYGPCHTLLLLDDYFA